MPTDSAAPASPVVTRKPTARSVALSLMRTAGYHDDARARVRLLVESRVSRADMERAWAEGERMRETATARELHARMLERTACRRCSGYGYLTRSGFPAPDAPYTDEEHARRHRCDKPGCPGPVRHVEPGARIPTPEEAMNAAEYASDTLEDR